jgi:hypothetical protein
MPYKNRLTLHGEVSELYFGIILKILPIFTHVSYLKSKIDILIVRPRKMWQVKSDFIFWLKILCDGWVKKVLMDWLMWCLTIVLQKVIKLLYLHLNRYFFLRVYTHLGSSANTSKNQFFLFDKKLLVEWFNFSFLNRTHES